MDAVVAEQQIDARWHCLTAEESLRRLGSSSNGLTSAEAAAALAGYGPNAITDAEPFSPWALFLAQFNRTSPVHETSDAGSAARRRTA